MDRTRRYLAAIHVRSLVWSDSNGVFYPRIIRCPGRRYAETGARCPNFYANASKCSQVNNWQVLRRATGDRGNKANPPCQVDHGALEHLVDGADGAHLATHEGASASLAAGTPHSASPVTGSRAHFHMASQSACGALRPSCRPCRGRAAPSWRCRRRAAILVAMRPSSTS